jgi:hypothetical protein
MGLSLTPEIEQRRERREQYLAELCQQMEIGESQIQKVKVGAKNFPSWEGLGVGSPMNLYPMQ